VLLAKMGAKQKSVLDKIIGSSIACKRVPPFGATTVNEQSRLREMTDSTSLTDADLRAFVTSAMQQDTLTSDGGTDDPLVHQCVICAQSSHSTLNEPMAYLVNVTATNGLFIRMRRANGTLTLAVLSHSLIVGASVTDMVERAQTTDDLARATAVSPMLSSAGMILAPIGVVTRSTRAFRDSLVMDALGGRADLYDDPLAMASHGRFRSLRPVQMTSTSTQSHTQFQAALRVRTCSHTVHVTCHQRYVQSLTVCPSALALALCMCIEFAASSRRHARFDYDSHG
jgi:hypothetical protein